MFVVAHNGSSILGGGEIAAALLLRGLQSRGHRVLMLCRDRRMRERLAAYDIPVEVLRVGGEVMVHDAFRLARALRRLRPDALLLTTFKKVALAGLGARMAGVPRVAQRVVLSSDVPRSPTYRLAFRHLVDVVVLNAEGMRDGFLAGDPRLDPAKVVAVHDGVHAPERRGPPGAVRRELGLADGVRVVGSVTRLAPQKRLDRLVRALALLPPEVHCVLAGEGEERPALEALARELGVEERLHLLGFRPDVGDVLDALDLFVLCSDREGMANAMLEAMAAGVPVVSTKVSGAREALEAAPDEVPPGLIVGFDPEDLAGAVREVLSDPARRAAMAGAARRRWAASFGWERFLDDWERLLGGCDA